MKNKKVLIADDEIINLNMLRTTLSKAGYEVVATSNGTEALTLAKEYLPFVVILDIMMPGTDGGEIADALKKDRKTEDIPVIFLSSIISPGEERLVADRSNAIFMAKPYSPDRLLNEVRKHFLKSNAT